MVSKFFALAVCLVAVAVINGAAIESENKHHNYPVPWVPGYLAHTWNDGHYHQWNQNWAHDWPFAYYPQHQWAEHPSFLQPAYGRGNTTIWVFNKTSIFSHIFFIKTSTAFHVTRTMPLAVIHFWTTILRATTFHAMASASSSETQAITCVSWEFNWFKRLTTVFLQSNYAFVKVWYRGCSNERFSNAGYQPPVVVKDGIVYFFCDVNGCNIF